MPPLGRGLSPWNDGCCTTTFNRSDSILPVIPFVVWLYRNTTGCPSLTGSWPGRACYVCHKAPPRPRGRKARTIAAGNKSEASPKGASAGGPCADACNAARSTLPVATTAQRVLKLVSKRTRSSCDRTGVRYRTGSVRHRSGGRGCIGRSAGLLPSGAAGHSFHRRSYGGPSGSSRGRTCG